MTVTSSNAMAAKMSLYRETFLEEYLYTSLSFQLTVY